MSLPRSLIGSRADLLIEAVVIAEIVAVPVLARAVKAVRAGRVQEHKRIQVGLAIVFAVATVALEVDIRMQGGMDAARPRIGRTGGGH